MVVPASGAKQCQGEQRRLGADCLCPQRAPIGFCAVTQGFYGNSGGVFTNPDNCYNNLGSLDLIKALLGNTAFGPCGSPNLLGQTIALTLNLRLDPVGNPRMLGPTPSARIQSPHLVACCTAPGSSSKIHSITEIGRLPFLIRSSWNWPSRKFSPCRSL
jgi:hypothetical protein